MWETSLFQLSFVDDLILFCRGDLHSVNVFKQYLNAFHELSGSHVNEGKSNCFIAGLKEEEALTLIQFLEFQGGKCPKRYLGVPLITTKLGAAECMSLVDNITSKVRS